MINWLKKLVNSKISITINITQPATGDTTVEEKVWPSALVMPAPVIVEQKGARVTPGNYRFAHDFKRNINGNEEDYWYTEMLSKSGQWLFVGDSLAHTKNKAMDLHLKLISGNAVRPMQTKTILWENMPADQVETWVGLLKDE
jgi:hypothetical protein